MMNPEKVKTVFTIKDAVTNIMQSVHDVIEISNNIEFKKQCLEMFSVNEFEDLKVDSSKKLTKLLKKRYCLHKKVDKDLSTNISGSSYSQSSGSNFSRSSETFSDKSETDCLVKSITSHYSPIRKRCRLEPLTIFPKNHLFSDTISRLSQSDMISIDTESFQDLEKIKFSTTSNENILDMSIISDFMEDKKDIFLKEISNEKIPEKINTKGIFSQPGIAMFDHTSQIPSVNQHVILNEGSPISVSSYQQDSFNLHYKLITPDSFSSSDDNFEALDNLFFYNQCPKKDFSQKL